MRQQQLSVCTFPVIVCNHYIHYTANSKTIQILLLLQMVAILQWHHVNEKLLPTGNMITVPKKWHSWMGRDKNCLPPLVIKPRPAAISATESSESDILPSVSQQCTGSALTSRPRHLESTPSSVSKAIQFSFLKYLSFTINIYLHLLTEWWGKLK